MAITYQAEGNIDTKFLIQSINDFCQYLEKPTVLVLDNAPTHRAKLFFEQLEKWEEKGLYILLAQIFAAFEHSGNLLEKSQV